MMSFKHYVFIALALLFAPFAWAGGAIQTNINGFPFHWDNHNGLVYNLDGGVLKSDNAAYDTPAESIALVNDAFFQWQSTQTSLFIGEGSFLPDIDTSNYASYFNAGAEECYDNDPNTPCMNPVIFDEDGAIIDQLFGNCANTGILGFAGPDDVDDGSGDSDQLIIRHGQALFSGACLPPQVQQPGCGSCKRVLTDAEMRTIMIHEVGHLLGMDHAQVNRKAYEACVQAGGCPAELADALPTMFPILVKGAHMETLHADDAAYFRRLYGDTSDTCSVSGIVLTSDGVTELRGAEVVAKNTDPDLEMTDAIAFVSGAEAPRFNNFSKAQGNCKSDCGKYLITGLRDGQTYQLCAQKISPQFNEGSSIEPLAVPYQGFTDICPDGLTVTCDCSPDCKEFTNVNITTDANPSSIEPYNEPERFTNPADIQAAGCSLVKPQSGFWKMILREIN